jgi:uncharacterized protein with ParB-like and HNH nuclease domain
MDGVLQMKFDNIKMLTSAGNYEINVPLDQLEHSIQRYINDYGLNLLPDFQRGHVWTEAQQRAYIEFFLRGGMTGRVIYLNQPQWGHFHEPKKGEYCEFVIVDGLQRLTALRAFLAGKIPAFGHFMPSADCPHRACPIFEDRLRMADANNNFKININNLKRREDVLRWYLEMNTGGTPHTDAEIQRVQALLEQEAKKAQYLWIS